MTATLCATLAAAGCTSAPSPDSPTSGNRSSSVSSGSARSAGAPATVARTAPTVIVLDASSSMLQTDAPGARIAAARSAVTTLAGVIPAGAPVGVVVFGTSVGDADSLKAAGCRDIRTLVRLSTADRSGLNTAVGGVAARGWTPLAGALKAAAALLPATGKQNIVLLTDGADTCEPAGPCPVARTLHDRRPGLAVHTVAFKAGSAARAALSCVASATGGVAVDAANTAQLSARIGATADPGRVATSLTSTGYRGLTIGMTASEAASRFPTFPAVAGKGTVRVVFVDCALTFVDGVLTEIAPQSGLATLDGLRPGDQMTRAVTLYGSGTASADNGQSVVVLGADPLGGTGYRIRYRPSGDPTSLAGTITTIYLCRCRPVTPVQPGRGDWHSGFVLVTTHSIGAADTSMTDAQIQRATGVTTFEGVGDGHYRAVGAPGFTSRGPLDGSNYPHCFGVGLFDGAVRTRATTDTGISLNDPFSEVQSVYGARLMQSIAYEQGEPYTVRYVRDAKGILVFYGRPGSLVTGFGVLPPTATPAAC